MRPRTFLAACACLALPMLAAAESGKLKLPPFTHLQQKATEVVDITIGSLPLGIASWLMDEDDPESAEMKKLIMGLKSVRVRSYQFDSDFAYSKADVDAVRSQLSGKGWTQLLQVRNRKLAEDVDIYMAVDNDKVAGFAIVASEPREFTILNIVGSIEFEQIAKLQKQFDLPGVGVESPDPDVSQIGLDAP